MMRKKLIAGVAVAALALPLAACGGDSENDGGGSSGDSIQISIFAGSIPESTPTGAGIKAMIEYLDEADVGIDATGYYDTALGDATTMVQGLQQGTIDVGVSGGAYFSGLVPQVQVFELPFLFEDVETAREATAPGPARDALFGYFDETEVVGLSLWENGMRQLSNNVRPIHTPADLQGIAMRTLPAPIQQAAWAEMGALPQAIDAAELYTALQQGTVQAQENPLVEIVYRKFYEVQPYITLTSHVYTPFTMAVSRMTWDKLNDEQKQALQEAAEAGREANLAANDEQGEQAYQTLLDEGIEIVEDPDREAFEELAVRVWPQFTDQYGTDILDLLTE